MQDVLDSTTPASLENMLCFGNRVSVLFLESPTHGRSCGGLLICPSAKTLQFQRCWAVMTSQLCNAGFHQCISPFPDIPPSNVTLAVPPRPRERGHPPSVTNRSAPLPPPLRPLHVRLSNVTTWWKETNQHCHWSIFFLIRNIPPTLRNSSLRSHFTVCQRKNMWGGSGKVRRMCSFEKGEKTHLTPLALAGCQHWAKWGFCWGNVVGIRFSA